MDPATLQQIQEILGNQQTTTNGTTSGLFDMQAIIEPLMPFIYALSAVSILIAILYIMNAITTWRSQRAILEIRKILREMNERDKARHAPESIPVPPAPTTPASVPAAQQHSTS